MPTLMVLGLILIILGFVLMILPELGRTHPAKETQEPEPIREREERDEHCNVRGGGIIMIGPIPIVFGSDSRTAIIMMLIALMIMLAGIIAKKSI